MSQSTSTQKFPVHLLTTSKTRTPFKFEAQNYAQVEGVSKFSPLGPLFAENQLLSESQASYPCYYKRYVDGIIVVFYKKSHGNWFKTHLQRSFIINFTHDDFPNNRVFPLDISFQSEEYLRALCTRVLTQAFFI